MKTVIETLTIDPEKYDLTRIAPLDQLLFVDIETTGFSAGSSSLYEIGCIRFENNIPKLIQFFAEDTTEEKEVLSSFFDLCHPSGTLIHFNGNTFDIPYMKAKARQYGLSSPFETMEGVDIYKRIMPYKDILGLPNCKQKTIEEFLGISREDQYNGGQLIDIYKEYCRHPSEESEKLLILHNNEDMKGMLKLLPILTYSDIFMQPFRVVKVQANHFTNVDQSAGDEVLMKLRFSSAFPIPFSMHKAGCHFSANDKEGFLKVPLFRASSNIFTPITGIIIIFHLRISHSTRQLQALSTRITANRQKLLTVIPERNPIIFPSGISFLNRFSKNPMKISSAILN